MSTQQKKATAHTTTDQSFGARQWTDLERRGYSKLEKAVNEALMLQVSNIHNSDDSKWYVLGEDNYRIIRAELLRRGIVSRIQLSEARAGKHRPTSTERTQIDIGSRNIQKQITKFMEYITDTYNDIVYHKAGDNIEFMGIAFIYSAHKLITSSEGRANQTAGYELIVGIQRFIEIIEHYRGKNMINFSRPETYQMVYINSEPNRVSYTLLDDLRRILTTMLGIYDFTGLNIQRYAPYLMIYCKYDQYLPISKVKPHMSQMQVIEYMKQRYPMTFNYIPHYSVLLLKSMVGSGKTTIATAMAKYLQTMKEQIGYNRVSIRSPEIQSMENIQMIFCTGITAVKMQVAANMYYNGIPFAIGSIDNDVANKYRITDSYLMRNTSREAKHLKRTTIICGPLVAYLLLKEDRERIDREYEDLRRTDPEATKPLSRYWLILDDPTVGADQEDAPTIQILTQIMLNLPLFTIFSSATMPDLDTIMMGTQSYEQYLRATYRDIDVSKVYPQEVMIGCDVMTTSRNQFMPHDGCTTRQQLDRVIRSIHDNAFLGRLYTLNACYILYNKIRSMKPDIIADIDLDTYFSNINNMTADKVRLMNMEILTRSMNNMTDAEIETLCQPSASTATQPYDYSKFGTTLAYRQPDQSLIATANPIQFSIEQFADLISDIKQAIPSIYDNIEQYMVNIAESQQRIERATESAMRALSRKASTSAASRSENPRAKDPRDRDEGITIEDRIDMIADDVGGMANGITFGFPLWGQINTRQHNDKYVAHVMADDYKHRKPIGFEGFLDDIKEINVSDDLLILLFAGVGIYCPESPDVTDVYTNLVLYLASNGQLAYLITDDSICYGTNYPIARVFITDDLARDHSIQTIFQLMGRTGRIGQSYRAECIIDDNTIVRLRDFINNPDSIERITETRNMTNIMIQTITNIEDQRQRMIEMEEHRRRMQEQRAQEKIRQRDIAQRIAKQQAEQRAHIKPISSIMQQGTAKSPDDWTEVRRTQRQPSSAPEQQAPSQWQRGDRVSERKPPHERGEAAGASSYRLRDRADDKPTAKPTSATSASTGQQTAKYVPPHLRK